jgi:hypothetical protein
MIECQSAPFTAIRCCQSGDNWYYNSNEINGFVVPEFGDIVQNNRQYITRKEFYNENDDRSSVTLKK